MTYRVQLSRHAIKEYKRLDSSVKHEIQAALDSLVRHPVSTQKVKQLKGRLSDYYRYRAGDYRIVYMVDQKEKAVYVDYIQHRREIYRRLE